MDGELSDNVVEYVLGGGGKVALHSLEPSWVVVRMRHHDDPETVSIFSSPVINSVGRYAPQPEGHKRRSVTHVLTLPTYMQFR